MKTSSKTNEGTENITEQQAISKAKVPMRQWVYLGLMLVILGLVLIPTLFPEVFVEQDTPRLTRPVLHPVEPPPVEEAVVPVEPPPPPFRHDLALEMARPHIDAAARRNLKAVGLNAADTIGAPADSMRAVTAVVTNKLEQLDPEVVLDKGSAASVKITLGTVAIVTFFLYLLLARLIPRRRRKKETADRRPPTSD